jgi:hypothetical protein
MVGARIVQQFSGAFCNIDSHQRKALPSTIPPTICGIYLGLEVGMLLPQLSRLLPELFAWGARSLGHVL